MAKSQEGVCGCGCGFRSSNQPLLMVAEMLHRAEAKAKLEEQKPPEEPFRVPPEGGGYAEGLVLANSRSHPSGRKSFHAPEGQ